MNCAVKTNYLPKQTEWTV